VISTPPALDAELSEKDDSTDIGQLTLFPSTWSDHGSAVARAAMNPEHTRDRWKEVTTMKSSMYVNWMTSTSSISQDLTWAAAAAFAVSNWSPGLIGVSV
jgi:hypothetical protein